MAKSRKRKAQFRDHGGGEVGMELCDDATAASSFPVKDGMDTSEFVAVSSAVAKPVVSELGKVKSRGIIKAAPQRRSVKIRKHKAVEKALSLMDKSAAKKQKHDLKTERIRTLKKLY